MLMTCINVFGGVFFFLAQHLFPSMIRLGKCCSPGRRIPFFPHCTPPGTSVLIVPKWHPAPRFCHHLSALTITLSPVLPSLSPSHPCLSILFVYSAACLQRWLVHPHLLHSYPQTWHRQAATAVSFSPGPPPLIVSVLSLFNCFCGLLVICDHDFFMRVCANVSPESFWVNTWTLQERFWLTAVVFRPFYKK